jgi:diguanylate cyclase (GGDEF)-like protein
VRPGGIQAAILPLAVAATVAVVVLATFARAASTGEWARFIGLALVGVSAHAFIARADRARAGHGAAVLVLPAGAVLLPLDLLVSLALVVSLPRWVAWPRAPRLTRLSELATEVAAATLAWLAAAGAVALASLLLDGEAAWALAGMVACAAFVATDQLSVFVGGRLTSRLSCTPQLSLGTELLLATLGAALAAACLTNPWLAPFAVAPLLLLRRWFEIPLLEHQARRDAKTGLFNAQYFELAVDRELAEARAVQRPMSVLLADLDLLRDINNAYGHLAGDAVLRGVGGVLLERLRTQDVPARFGGEEFAVLLPKTSHADALEIAECLRTAVAAARFPSGTAETALQATVSIGVASYPEHGTRAVQLLHRADVAVYRAKVQGRNRVQTATLDPPSSFLPDLRIVAGSRRDDGADPPVGAAPRIGRLSWLAPRRSGRPATFVGVATLAALALLGVSQASYLTAMLAPAIGGVAILVLRRAAMLQAERDSAAVAHDRADQLRRGADTLQTLNRSLERANRLLRERSAAAMETLAAAVDARDSHTAGHSRRVQTLALLLGRELGLSETELEALGHAARFHDVGKLAVPEAILLKSEKLGDVDWVVVRRHPEVGARLIEHLGFLDDALPAIRHHHERYDGTGYPDELAGEDIPLGARIIHLADALDAMLTSRPYRPALEALAALDQIRNGAGVQFCPRCVEALDRIMLAEFAKGADVPHELLAS